MRTRRSGFTLIEIMMFAALFAVSITGMTYVLMGVTRVGVRQSASVEVSTQSQRLLQLIQQNIEQSSVVELPMDVSTTTLKLRMASTSTDPTYIYASGTVAYLKQTDSGTPQRLTSDLVQVTDFTFAKRVNNGGKDSVSVNFTVVFNTSNLQQSFVQVLNSAIARVSAATFDSDIRASSSNMYKIGAAAQEWQSINNTIFFSGSNVGIGNAGPAQKLDVTGGATFSGNVGIGTATPSQKLEVIGNTSSTQLCLGGTCNSTWPSGGWSRAAPNVYLTTPTDNVGIGTASPDGKLHVSGGSTWTISGYNKSYVLDNGAAIKFTANSGGFRHGIMQWTDGMYFAHAPCDDGSCSLVMDMMIADNGNVMINPTANPRSKLDVAGSASDVVVGRSMSLGYDDISTNVGHVTYYAGNGSSPRTMYYRTDIAGGDFRIIRSGAPEVLVAYVNSTAGWQAGSSRTLKKNIRPLTDTDYKWLMDDFSKVNVFSYERKDDPARQEIGVIAEETSPLIRGSNDQSISYTRWLGYLTGVIKALQAENEGLKKDNEALWAKNAGLETRVSALERVILSR